MKVTDLQLARKRRAELYRARAELKQREAEIDRELAALEDGGRPTIEMLDQDSVPISRNVYLSEARANSFPTRKVGKRVMVRVEDFNAWLDAHPSAAKAPKAPASGPRDTFDELLEEFGAALAEAK